MILVEKIVPWHGNVLLRSGTRSAGGGGQVSRWQTHQSCRCLRQGRRHGGYHHQNRCCSPDGSLPGLWLHRRCGDGDDQGCYLLPSRRPAEEVWSIMKERKLLHVPIVGDDFRPLGVINARDALLVLLEGSETRSRFCVITSWALDIDE